MQPKHSHLALKSQAMIYEINFRVYVEVVEAFDNWLNKHTEEMLAVPGFISAVISVPKVTDENQKHRCVQYRLSEQSVLDHYLDYNAETVLAECMQHFGGQVTTQSRVLSVMEASLSKHGFCANCETELLGRFCSVCGQREEPRVPTLGSLIGEFTNTVFAFESKLWRSLRLLLFKPGQLTIDYLSGKRQKYMSPLRLYLLFSIVTFAYFALLNSQDGLGVKIKNALNVEVSQEVDNNEAVEIDSGEGDFIFNLAFFSDKVNAQIEQRLKDGRISIERDIEQGNTKNIFRQFFGAIPTTLLLFLPIIALVFKVFYIGSGKHYVEHLIYILHNHAFLFAALILTNTFPKVVGLWSWFDMFVGLGLFFCFSIYSYSHLRKFLIEKFSKFRVKAFLYFSIIVGFFALLFSYVLSDGINVFIFLLWSIYVPFYIYRSMRLVYPRSHWATVAFFGMFSMIYLILLFFMLLGSVIFVGYTYS